MTRVAWNELWPAGSESTEWSHSGIAVTDTGTVIFAEPGGGALVQVHPDGSLGERLPVPLLEIHGIQYLRDDSGEGLWLADPGVKPRPERAYEAETRAGSAGRLDLDTRIFKALEPPRIAEYAEGPWRPTSVVVGPGRDDGGAPVFVADGYGASLVHLYASDRYVTTLDGTTSGTRFDCPHGLVVDTRGDVPLLVVADRGNHRLVAFTLEGAFVREILDPRLVMPSSLALRGSDLLVTELDGALLAVDRDDSVRALVETREGSARPGWPNREVSGRLVRPRFGAPSLNSPHGLAVAANGRIYLTEWLIGGRQWELTVEE